MPTTQTFRHTTGAELHYSMHGQGTAVLGLHGAYSTREEIVGVVEPTFEGNGGYRRLYPDLPGMGESPSHESVQTANDVVDLLDELVSSEIGSEPFLVVGHSLGGHLARGLAARRPDQVAGLVLICPVVPPNTAEAHAVVRSAGHPEDLISPEHVDDYSGYFVVQTSATAARFNEVVVPSLGRFDAQSVGALMSTLTLDPDPDQIAFAAPTLVLTGRHDSFVGFRDQLALIDRYPDSTHILVADAGHALPHEHPDQTNQLLGGWLSRALGPRHLVV